MGIIIDSIIIFIIIISIYMGYKRGIVNVGIKLFSIIVSLLLSMILCGPLTNLVINNTEIDEKIEEIIIINFSSNDEKNSDTKKSVDQFIQDYAKSVVQDTQNALVQNSAKSISNGVIKAGVMIVLFVVVRILFIILQVFTDILTKIPIIKQVNEFGGILYSLMIALVIIYVALTILFFVSTMSGNENLISVIENTFVTKWFYKLMFST